MPPSDIAKPARTRLNREERRTSLLAAAAGIVETAGVDALTMERVAAGAGVNKALVYRFFSNRNDVIVALWQQETEAFDARIQGSVARETDLEGKLRAILNAWLDDVEAGGGVLARLDAPGVGPPALQALRAERRVAVVYYLADLFREEYDIAPREALTAAATLGSAAQGLANLWQHTGWPRTRLASSFVRLCIGAVEAVAR